MRKGQLAKLIVLSVAIVLLAFAGAWAVVAWNRLHDITRPATPAELAALMHEGDIILDAIERYRADRGGAPEHLDDLVPDYLHAVPLGNQVRAAPGREPDYRWIYIKDHLLAVRTGEYRTELRIYHDPESVWILDRDGDEVPLDATGHEVPKPR